MANDVITKSRPSGAFNLSAVVLTPGVSSYQILLDNVMSNDIETDMFLALNDRMDDNDYYPSRGW